MHSDPADSVSITATEGRSVHVTEREGGIEISLMEPITSSEVAQPTATAASTQLSDLIDLSISGASVSSSTSQAAQFFEMPGE